MNAMSKIALAALAAVALAPFAAHAEKVNLTYLTHWPPESVAMLEKAATAYGKDHPDVSISVRAVPFGDLLTTLRASGGSAAGGATMASIYNAWLPDLAKDKLIGPVPDAMGAEVKADWPAGIVGAASTGGALYGFPNEIDVYALNYNKAMFETAGIKAPPTTWAEFLADAKALADKSKGQQGFGVINSWTAGVIHPFASLLASDGGQLVGDGKPQLDSPAAKETFSLYEKLVKDGLSDPTMGTSDANTTGPFLDNFVSGKTGMIIMANWWESALKSGMGAKFGDIATAPIPVGPHGDKSHSISYSWMTVVNAKASPAEQKAAWEFLSWLNGPKSGPNGGSAMGEILVSMGILPSRTSDAAAFASKLNDPFLKAYIAAVPDAVPFPVVLGGQEFSESLQRHVEDVEFGKASAADAAAAAQTDAVSILGK